MFLASLEIKRACVMYWVIPFLVGVRVVLVGPVGSMVGSQSPFGYRECSGVRWGAEEEDMYVTERT